MEGGLLAEVILHKFVAAGRRLFVEEVPVFADLAMKVVESTVIWIRKYVPVTVKTMARAMIHIHQNDRLCLRDAK